jgi:hypothetical protein
LGAVGQALAQLKNVPVPLYAGYGAAQITHDVLCNQVSLSLLQQGAVAGYEPVWLGKYEAQVHSADGTCVLEPDSLLIFRKPGETPLSFVIEYHNEDHRGRCMEKVEKYERAERDQYWREAWPLENFPTVLVAFTHKAVSAGYLDAVRRVRGRGQRVRYLGKKFSIRDMSPLVFYDFNERKNVNIFKLNA